METFENQWGDKLEFHDDRLEFIIGNGWKISGLGDKVPSQKAGVFPIYYNDLTAVSFSFSETSYSMITGRTHGYLRLGDMIIYFHSGNGHWLQAKKWIESRLYHYNPSKANEREKALDYDAAIEIWEGLGNFEEAARLRKLRTEDSSVKVSQKVVHGDDITKTEIKDSVLNRSNVGSGGDDKFSKLKELKEMFDSGFISKEEMEEMKKEILGK